MSLTLELDGWVDGERVVATVRPPPLDRWQLHSADEARITVRSADDRKNNAAAAAAADGLAVCVLVRQKPRAIPAAKMGVGAVFWEGELALSAFLVSQPRHRWQGATVVELGAGPGVAGLVAAAMGARRVVISDLAKVVPLIRENAALNGHGEGEGPVVYAEELEWGKEGYLDRARAVARLASGRGGGGGGGNNNNNNNDDNNNDNGVDWVIAADVTYVDGDGESPSTEHFVRACHALAGCRTRVVVALEVRAGSVREELRRHGARLFERGGQLRGDALPKGFCRQAGEHLEVYEFGGPRDLRSSH
jgi:protein N-lysine methyltransferase METTL21D